MSKTIRTEDDSLVCIESRYDDKNTHEIPSISNEFLEKFYSHCANIIIDAWRMHQLKKKNDNSNKPLPVECENTDQIHEIQQNTELLSNAEQPTPNSYQHNNMPNHEQNLTNTELPPQSQNLNFDQPNQNYNDEFHIAMEKQNEESNAQVNLNFEPIHITTPNYNLPENQTPLNYGQNYLKKANYSNYDDMPIGQHKKPINYDMQPIPSEQDIEYRIPEVPQKQYKGNINYDDLAVTSQLHDDISYDDKPPQKGNLLHNRAAANAPVIPLRSNYLDERPLPTLKKNVIVNEESKLSEYIPQSEENSTKPKKPFLKRAKKYDPKESITYKFIQKRKRN